ncbi:MAG: nucleotidyltransferase family protein [Vicinamibacterales bacterium]|nr:nucleotidyltransferase family protein [Vicinamibacterales bacterium]
MYQPYAGLILAAGASSRMGRPKALLPIGSDTFVSRMAATMTSGGAAQVVVVVAPATSREIREALGVGDTGVPATVVVNPRPEQGQLSSLLIGLDALERSDIAGVLVCPVDIPLFTAATVHAILAAARSTFAPIVRPASHGRHGHPVLFGRRVFADLRQADLAQGARSVVQAHADEIVDVEVDDPGAFIDIDTPDDYRRWIANLPA